MCFKPLWQKYVNKAINMHQSYALCFLPGAPNTKAFQGTLTVACPAKLIEITPPKEHISLEELLSVG